jgi:hypothetical protein
LQESLALLDPSNFLQIFTKKYLTEPVNTLHYAIVHRKL